MEFSTDMFVSDINSLKNDQISDTEKNHAVRNIRLNKIKSALEQMIILKDYESTDDFKKKASKIISGKEPRQRNKTFVDYLDEFVSLKNNKGTIALYNSTRKKLEAFDPKATLDSIDRVWLSRLEKELTETMSINGISIQLRNIRAVFNYAIDEGYTSNYPFRKFHIKQEKTPKRSLTLEQLRTLMEFDCEEFQKQYRDIFMLMLYLIGINAADLLNAKADDIDNQGRLNYHRAKTNLLY
jgi:site-specific recombinase XerD